MRQTMKADIYPKIWENGEIAKWTKHYYFGLGGGLVSTEGRKN